MTHRGLIPGLAGTVLVGLLSTTGAEAAVVDPETSASTTKRAAPSFLYDSKGRRDPFVPLVREGRLVAAGPGAQVEPSKPVLYGILWDPGGHSIALVNDAEVRVGDRIGDYEVREIRLDAVVLNRGGEEPLVLRLAFDAPPASSTPDATTGGQNP